MDIKIMEYFLAVTREGNISSAAEALHISQPALSRKIKELEDDLGVILFERGSRRIKLTEEGIILRRRADEIVNLMQITEREISQVHSNLSGEIRIGAGESLAFRRVSTVYKDLHRQFPNITLSVTSGDTEDLMYQLDSGLIDIALIFSKYDMTQYQGINLPEEDYLGILMRADCPLSEKSTITNSDLINKDLIIPRTAAGLFSSAPELSSLKVVAVYNLIYNASILVEDGIGYAVGFGGLINVADKSALTFKPLENIPLQKGSVIWRKYKIFSPAVNVFIDLLTEAYGR